MNWIFRPARMFGDFAAEWDRLATALGAAPFLQARFISPLLAEFAHGEEMLAVCSEGGKARAMTLIAPRGHGVWESYQPSQLPLGPWIMGRNENVGALTESLLRHLPGHPLQLGLTQIDPQLIARPADHGRIRTLDYIQTAWLPVTGTFEAYWQARGKNLRVNMRKQRKKLHADGLLARFEMLTRSEDVASVIESYGRLESAGWKASMGTAIHPDNAQGRFYRAMLEGFCATESARMYRYWFGDKVVAVDLCIEGQGMLVVLKTTYDESMKTLSPASLLREDEMRAIFDEGRIQRIEFFGRLMEWHTHWTKEVRMLYHVNQFRWGWIPRVHAWLTQARATATAQIPSSTPTSPSEDLGERKLDGSRQ